MEWQSTRWNIEGCKNTYASGHRGSLRVFPHTTIPTYLCCVTRLQESLLKCYAYRMVLTYDVFYVICMRSIATTVPRNQGSYFLCELGERGPFKGLSATFLKSASKRLSSSSDARPMAYSRAFGDGPRNLNHGQVTWTTPELAPPLLTTTPHQREDVSALDIGFVGDESGGSNGSGHFILVMFSSVCVVTDIGEGLVDWAYV
ncbi:hypothetical protein TNCV_1747131 [Trichonephila clavipes]|nr:hypothetical protein TNCV_1747131 [Trichonephila clavipes]